MHDEKKHPWILGNLRISSELIAKIDREAITGYENDEESCGLLLGPSSDSLLIDEIVPMQNRAARLHALDPVSYPRTARTYFDIDPLKFERALASGEANGRPVKVVYHSHLDADAYFSETDADAAIMGGPEPTYDLAYLVTSVMKGVVQARALFIWAPAERKFISSSIDVAVP